VTHTRGGSQFPKPTNPEIPFVGPEAVGGKNPPRTKFETFGHCGTPCPEGER